MAERAAEKARNSNVERSKESVTICHTFSPDSVFGSCWYRHYSQLEPSSNIHDTSVADSLEAYFRVSSDLAFLARASNFGENTPEMCI